MILCIRQKVLEAYKFCRYCARASEMWMILDYVKKYLEVSFTIFSYLKPFFFLTNENIGMSEDIIIKKDVIHTNRYLHREQLRIEYSVFIRKGKLTIRMGVPIPDSNHVHALKLAQQLLRKDLGFNSCSILYTFLSIFIQFRSICVNNSLCTIKKRSIC